MADFSRAQRVGDEIQRELAEIVRLELRDPRVKFVTFNAVEVSRDLSHAKVFFTTLDPHGAEDCGKGLQHAAKFLRGELSHRLRLRSVPELHFVFDESVERGSRISQAIDAARADDARVIKHDD